MLVWTRTALPVSLALLLTLACRGSTADRGSVLTASVAPLHLEESLDRARVVASVPGEAPEAAKWAFDTRQSEWRTDSDPGTILKTEQTGDSLRIDLAPGDSLRIDLAPGDSLQIDLAPGGAPGHAPSGAFWVDLPAWHPGDWDFVQVRARASGSLEKIGLRFNRRERDGEISWAVRAEEVHVLADETVQTYRMRPGIRVGQEVPSWHQLGIHLAASGPSAGRLEILSIELIPTAARYLAAGAGVGGEERSGSLRRSLYLHTPGEVAFRVEIPAGGRLDFGLGVLDDQTPIRFRVRVADAREREPALLFEYESSDRDQWLQHSVDLSAYAGKVVDLILESESTPPGAVALWAAPTLSGSISGSRPNVVLYVIDGGGSDFMSLYGYRLPTTPHLDRLAAEGVVFETAFSNSAWTKPSTATLLTSLQHSVLGGFETYSDPLPDQAVTLAEHLHAAGYQTGVFVSNPFAGRMSSLDRGVDVLRDTDSGKNSVSSAELHDQFWRWREAYPGSPFWVHFQTTDVHSPHAPSRPFAHRFTTAEETQRYRTWLDALREAGGTEPDSPAWEALGIDRKVFYDIEERLYAECMAHNDQRLGELVERLEEFGEWQNTVLIVTADHGVQAAGLRRDFEPSPRRVLADAWETRIPLLVVWPGRLAGGRRVAEPVSLIDVMPTILELAELPASPISQGHSLVPYLLGESARSRPVILDQFERDPESGELRGLLEIVDGRWAASWQIGSDDDDENPPAPVLLFDLQEDPFCRHSVHEEHPDRVLEYAAILRRVWQEHRELGQNFSRSETPHLSRSQLQTLRSLGYIQ